MGYESKMYIGEISGTSDKEYFIRHASIDLCKCGCEGALPDLISSVSHSNKYPLVYWYNPFEVNKPDVIKHMKDSDHELYQRFGLETEDMVEAFAKLFESWENRIEEDMYGDRLRAVPIEEVYNAMQESQMEIIEEDGVGYRRYTIALGMLKEFMLTFGDSIHVVFYGH